VLVLIRLVHLLMGRVFGRLVLLARSDAGSWLLPVSVPR
jgi:hypothetical protein